MTRAASFAQIEASRAPSEARPPARVRPMTPDESFSPDCSIAPLAAADAPTPWRDPRGDDPIEILRAAHEGLAAGQAVALATLVEIRGGAARALGAQMAIRGDGSYCGYVSGGCLEAAIAAEALAAMAEGRDRDVRFGLGSPFFDIALPCGGGISIAIHLLRAAAPLAEALRRLEARAPVALRYDRATQSLALSDAAATRADDSGYLRGYRPKARLLIVGRGVEAEATARVAMAAGYEARMLTREADLVALTDADSAVAILHHDLEREEPALRAALAGGAFYIGALGGRHTHQERLTRLSALGYGAADLARIKGPIGIFGGARESASLALSIMADVALARMTAGSL